MYANKALDDARNSLAVIQAVNGLRDRSLCKELVAHENLTWADLENILRSRASAQESRMKLHGINVNVVSTNSNDSRRSVDETLRNECCSSRSHNADYVSNRDRNRSCSSKYSSYGSRSVDINPLRRSGDFRCFECGKHWHTARRCPEVQCLRCRRFGHIARDCGASDCWRCGGTPHTKYSSCHPSTYVASHNESRHTKCGSDKSTHSSSNVSRANMCCRPVTDQVDFVDKADITDTTWVRNIDTRYEDRNKWQKCDWRNGSEWYRPPIL